MTTYQLLDLVISSLAAIGTISATIVALYLANRRRKVVLKVSVYKALLFGGREPSAECLAFRIVNRSEFPVRIDSMGWTFPKSPTGLCAMINDRFRLDESQYLKLPMEIPSGEAAPPLFIPWDEFEESLHYLATHDSDGTFHREAANRAVKFYLTTPRTDGNLVFDINDDVQDAFAQSARDD